MWVWEMEQRIGVRHVGRKREGGHCKCFLFVYGDQVTAGGSPSEHV